MLRTGNHSSIGIDKTERVPIGGKVCQCGLLLVYSRLDGIDDLLSVPDSICDHIPYCVEQADCSRERFSHTLRAPCVQEYCRYEPDCVLECLIRRYTSSAGAQER